MLFPFDILPNQDGDQDFNVLLLVDEMCASMCDIFSAVLKDNGIATIIGSKTMGAGGNVETHFEAPNSHLIVNQTESLIVRKDGSYVEHNGIEPDVALKVSEYSHNKYDAVRKKAIELLTSAK